jgi:hypothetical protein
VIHHRQIDTAASAAAAAAVYTHYSNDSSGYAGTRQPINSCQRHTTEIRRRFKKFGYNSKIVHGYFNARQYNGQFSAIVSPFWVCVYSYAAVYAYLCRSRQVPH